MPLDRQVVEVKFVEGLDTRTQNKLTVPGKLRDLINLTLSEDNSLRLRDGLSPLVTSATGNGLFTRSDELLVVNGPTVKTISTASTPVSAITVSGQLAYVGVSKKEIRKNGGIQDQPDCAVGDGYVCYVWRQNTFNGSSLSRQGIRCTIVDATTGAHVLDEFAIDSTVAAASVALSPRVVFSGGAFFIFYVVGTGAATALTCRVIQTSAPSTVGAATALVTSANLPRQNFDACAFVLSGANGVAVIYKWTDGVTSLRGVGVTRIGTTPSASVGPTNLITEAAVPNANIHAVGCAVFPNGTSLGVFFVQNGGTPGIAALVLSTLFATTAGPLIIYAYAVTAGATHVCACTSGNNLQVFADQQGAWSTNALNPISTVTVDVSLIVVSAGATLVQSASYGGAGNPRGPQGPWIFGKPFEFSGRTTLPVCVMENWGGTGTGITTSNLQNVIFLLDGTTGNVVGKALYGSFGVPEINGSAPAVGSPCGSPALNSSSFVMTAMESTVINLFGGIYFTETGLVSLTMTPNISAAPIKAQLGESTFVAGGSISSYDGVLVSECGFNLSPEGIIVAATAGGACTAGVHQVTATYEWTNAAGELFDSAPAPAVQITTGGGNNTIQVRVPTLQLAQRTSVTISIWVTAAGGTTFNLGAQFIANDTTVPFVTFSVSDADATFGGNRLLYSQPNNANSTLANTAPGPCSTLAVMHNRLWYDKTDQPFQFGYSQRYANNVGLRFNDSLGGSVPSQAGTFAGFVELDEKIIVLCSKKLFAVYGSGPQPSGAFSSYSDPQEIPSDVGCSEPRSILKFPHGIIFKSLKGWYLLGRDLTVKYIGAGVAAYDPYAVNASVLVSDKQECRFALNTSAVLVFSSLVGQWSVYSSSLTFGYQLNDVAWWPALGTFVGVSTTVGLLKEVAGQTTDGDGTFTKGIAWSIQTAPLHLAALESFQRVRWLYLTATAATGTSPTIQMGVGVAINDQDSQGAQFGYTFNVDFSTMSFPATSSDTIVDVRHKITKQKCKSVLIALSGNPNGEAAPVPITGIQAIALEIGLKKGVNRLPAAQTVR